MKGEKRFPLQILATIGIVGALSAYPLARYATGEIILSAVTGAALSTINVVLGYLTIEYAFEKSYTIFLRAVLGGMGLRMLLMLGGVVLLIMVAHLHAIALTVSLFFFYAVYLILEVLFLQRKAAEKSRGDRNVLPVA